MPAELECVPQQMTILVLGNAASGKTQIIRQFVECDFQDTYRPTKHAHTYYKSVGLNERMYQLAIIDLPLVFRTAKQQIQDWESVVKDDSSANAFVFVFDLTCEESFGHMRRLREQMHEILQIPLTSNGSTGNSNSTSNGHVQNGSSPVPLIVMGNKYDLLFANRGQLTNRRYVEIVNIIKKQWKWQYVECSAKHNWQIQQSFKTLTKLIDSKLFGTRPAGAERLIPGVLRRNRCTLC